MKIVNKLLEKVIDIMQRIVFHFDLIDDVLICEEENIVWNVWENNLEKKKKEFFERGAGDSKVLSMKNTTSLNGKGKKKGERSDSLPEVIEIH